MNIQAPLLTALSLLVNSTGAAQTGTASDIWHARPRYAISLGTEPGPLRAPDNTADSQEGAPWGWRLGGIFRPAHNWVLGASYSFHQSRGHMMFLDSVVHVPGHWDGLPPFFVFWVAPYDRSYADQVTIDQEIQSQEAHGGYSIPGKWPRRSVFATFTVLTGARRMEVKERYVYAFNGSTPEEAIHMEARANGWTWMLRLRADLYITKFISAYSEFILSEPVGDVQLSSSATWHGETRSLPRSRKTHTEFLGFGVALHL